MKAVRVAVIGAGALGRHHARILSSLAGAQLAGIADTRPDHGTLVAEQARTRCVVDFRELIPHIDAAVVAVPTQAHYAIAAELLRADVDVLVEKPIAANVEQAHALVALAEARGAVLQVGHVERFNPALAAALPYLGSPRFIRAERFSPYAFRSMDIGVVHDLMIHDIDLVLSLTDASIERVEACGTTILGGHEDCAEARLTLADGCLVDLSANRVSPVATRRLQIWSDRGCALLDLAARTVTIYRQSAGLRTGPTAAERAAAPGASVDELKSQVFGHLIEIETPAVESCDPLTEELKEFLHCVQTRESPRVDGRHAARAMDVADRILADIATRSTPMAHCLPTPFRDVAPYRKLAG